MDHDRHSGPRSGDSGRRSADVPSAGSPGKQTLVEQALTGVPPVQRRATADEDPGTVHHAAERGVATPSSALPHGDAIQRAFGRHDVSSVQAHTGPEATASAKAMGAAAYAVGNHVVLGGGTDLHTVAHEAAHVVQQRGGVQLKGGVGQAGDAYERHADEVADRVVRGEPAEAVLDRAPGGGSAGGASGAPVQRKELEPEALKSSMTTTMRTDVPNALAAIDPTLGNEPALLAEGLESAKLIYAKACVALKTKVPSLAGVLPPPSQLTAEVIASVDAKIRACKDIVDSLGEAHWETHKNQLDRPRTREAYLEERNQAERVKAASAWSQTALPIVQLSERQRNRSNLRMMERREGRDLHGRLGYMMMSTETPDVIDSIGVDGADVATARPQGAGALANRLGDIFSGAACHKDARHMVDLMSAHKHAGPIQHQVHSKEEVPAVLDEIMSSVSSCEGTTKLLKLSVYSNHSIMYVIGNGKATRLETVAGHDSKSILINDLIRNEVSSQDARTWIGAGLSQLCMSDDAQGVQLEYEVHKAATMEQVEDRTQRQLGDRMSELGVGMVVGSWEMSKLRDEQAGSMTTGEDLQADYEVGPIAKKTQLKLPQSTTHRSGVTFHELSSATVVAVPQAGTEYRVSARKSWLRVRVDQVIAQGEPAWMHPLLALTVIDVNPNLVAPVLVQPQGNGTTKQLMHWMMVLKGFDLQQVKSVNLMGREFDGRDGSRWRVTDDPQGTGMQRPVTMVQVAAALQ